MMDGARERGQDVMQRPVYLETKDLVVGYDRKPLISDVNIQLHAGEILTLIGPNGAVLGPAAK